MKVSHEPAMASATVSAVLALLVGYGILDTHRASLWSALALTLLPLLPLAQGWVTRGLVVPVAKLRSQGRHVPQREPTQGRVAFLAGALLLAVLGAAIGVLLMNMVRP